MTLNEENVRDALRTVIDPDLGRDLVSLNMIEGISIDGKKVSFTVNLTTPACPMKEEIRDACIKAVTHLVDKEAVVKPEMSSRVTGGRTSGQGDENLLKEVKNIVAVASGKGGVGKSTVSVNLAVALAQTGARVGLVDTDIYGPSIPTMFDIHDRPDITVQRKLVPLEKYGVKLLSMGFLISQDEAVVWRGPMVSSAVKQFLSETDWGELDYLILDLPPGTGDIQLTIVQSVPLTGAIIVSTPQVVALDDARKGVAMFGKVNVPVLGIIENMAYFSPPDLPDRKYHIFGKDGAKNLAEKMGVAFLGEIPIEEQLREGGDSGRPIVVENPKAASSIAITALAKRTAQQIAIRNATGEPTKKVEILYR